MGALKLEDIPTYTYDDYKEWEGDWELIYGFAYAMDPSPMIKHQSISNNIAWELKNMLSKCKKCQALLPIDWKIAEDTVVQPDNSVICFKPTNEAYISKAPTIIFEVLSKATARKDQTTKYELYEQEGVKYYIIVSPDDKVAKVYELKDGRYTKVCDATNETVEFTLKECDEKVVFDFSKIW